MLRRIAVLSAALFSLPLQADVIFTNFADLDGFDTNTGLTVADSSGNDLKTSLSFTPTQDFQLTQIDFVTSLLDAGDLNQVTLTLSSADANGNPGASIEVFSFSGQMGVLGSASTPPLALNAVSAIAPVLRSGTTYWITAESSPDVTVVWNQNTLSPNDVGTMAQYESGAWNSQSVTRGALRIIGTPVTVSAQMDQPRFKARYAEFSALPTRSSLKNSRKETK